MWYTCTYLAVLGTHSSNSFTYSLTNRDFLGFPFNIRGLNASSKNMWTKKYKSKMRDKIEYWLFLRLHLRLDTYLRNRRCLRQSIPSVAPVSIPGLVVSSTGPCPLYQTMIKFSGLLFLMLGLKGYTQSMRGRFT